MDHRGPCQPGPDTSDGWEQYGDKLVLRLMTLQSSGSKSASRRCTRTRVWSDGAPVSDQSHGVNHGTGHWVLLISLFLIFARVRAHLLSRCQLFATAWTVVCQAPLSMGVFRQEFWSSLPFPSPGHPPNPGIKPLSLTSAALTGRFFTTGPPGTPFVVFVNLICRSLCCAVPSLSVAYDSLRPHDCSPSGSSVHGDSPGKNSGLGFLALLQGIFPSQG